MQTKKVSNIEELHATTDGKPYWVISFEGVKPTGTEWTKPSYAIGTELNVEMVKPEKGKWYYKIVKDSTQAISAASANAASQSNKASSHTPSYDSAIMLQVAFKGAVEAEGYWYVPDGKQHTDRVIENTDNLVAGLQEILKTRFSKDV